jgi:hypothetical protein
MKRFREVGERENLSFLCTGNVDPSLAGEGRSRGCAVRFR